jgi:predicted phosphodiesterase
MRVAIVSDIHGNRHAFEAVLADADAAGVQAIWCLGDLVGYGAEPDACVALAAARSTVNLAGNHDMAVTGALSLDEFSPNAAAAARWTRDVIGARARDWLAGLAPAGRADGLALYHGSPRDPVWEYVLSVEAAEACLDEADGRISLIGHSHMALAFHRPDGGPVGAYRRHADTAANLATGGLAAQPGQRRPAPRRRSAGRLARARHECPCRRLARTEYDVDGAAAAIRAAGLPGSLADRLAAGR